MNHNINDRYAGASSEELYQRAKILKGYAVSSSCKGCGSCVDLCPAQCINNRRRPVYIDQERCLKCGTCASVCDHHAIYAVHASS